MWSPGRILATARDNLSRRSFWHLLNGVSVNTTRTTKWLYREIPFRWQAVDPPKFQSQLVFACSVIGVSLESWLYCFEICYCIDYHTHRHPKARRMYMKCNWGPWARASRSARVVPFQLTSSFLFFFLCFVFGLPLLNFLLLLVCSVFFLYFFFFFLCSGLLSVHYRSTSAARIFIPSPVLLLQCLGVFFSYITETITPNYSNAGRLLLFFFCSYRTYLKMRMLYLNMPTVFELRVFAYVENFAYTRILTCFYPCATLLWNSGLGLGSRGPWRAAHQHRPRLQGTMTGGTPTQA